MKKLLFSIIVCMLFPVAMFAQIGYQVSLLNSATGEPRANESVTAEVTITDKDNKVVLNTSQKATTNDFGILSLTVGDENTFKEVAIGRLPLYIEVSVEGKMIGKSQILNVPVAEVSNTLKSDFTLDELCGKEWSLWSGKILFNKEGKYLYTVINPWGNSEQNGEYEIQGNNIYLYHASTQGIICDALKWWKNDLLQINYYKSEQ